jgi:chemotaxis methyl-accepting protein methylase
VSAAVRAASRLLAERAGLHLSRGLHERLAACVQREAQAREEIPERYVAGLAADPEAFQRLLDCVTIQETSFFRHPDQFAALERNLLPALPPPVTIWSAGCANGQEAYSLAMVLAGSGCSDWQVLATDISSTAVARTSAGRYTMAELAGLPAPHRRWLRQAGEAWEVDPALRQRLQVQRINLTERFPCEAGRCQVVFCRNVLIYLARAEVAAFMDRLGSWLAPGGAVFLGYSETLTAPIGRLRVEQLGDAWVLRRPAPTSSAGAAPARRRPQATPVRAEVAGAAGTLEALAMVATGEAAAARGDLGSAVGDFRKAVYLDPDQPIAHFQLGLALEAGGDVRSARRAYAAALGALDRCDPETVASGLEGWRPSELGAVLRDKLAKARAPTGEPDR